MKNFYLGPGFLLSIVKPPGLLFFWSLALWLTTLTEAKSFIRGVGNKPALVSKTISIRNAGLRRIPVLNDEPAYFLRNYKAFPP